MEITHQAGCVGLGVGTVSFSGGAVLVGILGGKEEIPSKDSWTED